MPPPAANCAHDAARAGWAEDAVLSVGKELIGIMIIFFVDSYDICEWLCVSWTLQPLICARGSLKSGHDRVMPGHDLG